MATDKVDHLLQDLGGETGCKRFARAFYARVAAEPELRTLFPGKSLRCAIEEFSAFLVQFLDGDDNQTQFRWWLSLRESHARFEISPAQRTAWLRNMDATIESMVVDSELRLALQGFFVQASSYVIGGEAGECEHSELARLWRRQLSLDRLIDHIAQGRDSEAIALAPDHAWRQAVFVGILARFMAAGREALVDYVLSSIECNSIVAVTYFHGKALLHFAAGSGCVPAVRKLLGAGADPDVLDGGGHTPLYRAANECGSEAGAEVVRELVRAGATVDHCGGITRSTALHAASRRGHLAVAEALLEAGASTSVRDRRGFTPIDRAVNCRKFHVVDRLISWSG